MTDSLSPTEPDYAALIGSRICHDLISPIGAIGNGVELLQMGGGSASGPEFALIAESAASANARIRFFRLAFGAATAGQRLSRSEVQTTLADLVRGSRIRIDWSSTADLGRTEVKLACLALMCLETAMPRGGEITIRQGPTGWRILGTALRLRIDDALWSALPSTPAAAALTPGLVHFGLFAEELRRQSVNLTLSVAENEIEMRF